MSNEVKENLVQKFVNEDLGFEIRTIELNDAPWFVAKDVASACGYTDTTQAIRQHTKGGVEFTLPSKGGNQVTKVIPESDLYRLILRSHKPEAEPFQDWVTEEVLPSIRKTGGYSVDNSRMTSVEIQRDQANQLASLREEVSILRENQNETNNVLVWIKENLTAMGNGVAKVLDEKKKIKGAVPQKTPPPPPCSNEGETLEEKAERYVLHYLSQHGETPKSKITRYTQFIGSDIRDKVLAKLLAEEIVEAYGLGRTTMFDIGERD